jgi:23S rRNA pseudouridine1911/1915/1917 synthase
MPWSMAWWSEAGLGAGSPVAIQATVRAGPPGWLPAALNRGWIYRERVAPAEAGMTVSAYYAARHRHSDRELWQARLASGEIHHNGAPLRQEVPLAAGDRLAWHRPPWLEGAVPAAWGVVFDDGDLQVIDKPAGLPVLPAGGWLEHTALRLLEQRHAGDPRGIPRPVHRLGRFTSGLLVCARQPATRAWLSARLRESTAAGLAVRSSSPATGPGPTGTDGAFSDPAGCRKRYRALLVPGVLPLAPGQALAIHTPIGRRPHPQLGAIWCAAAGSVSGDLAAASSLTLLERDAAADLVEVAIASGRPHQIRIHCAALGAPLLGDPLYRPGGGADPDARPGDGGYALQAWRLELVLPSGAALTLTVPAPLQLGTHPPPRLPPTLGLPP